MCNFGQIVGKKCRLININKFYPYVHLFPIVFLFFRYLLKLFSRIQRLICIIILSFHGTLYFLPKMQHSHRDCTNSYKKKELVSKWPRRNFGRFHRMPDLEKNKTLFSQWKLRLRRRPADVI